MGCKWGSGVNGVTVGSNDPFKKILKGIFVQEEAHGQFEIKTLPIYALHEYKWYFGFLLLAKAIKTWKSLIAKCKRVKSLCFDRIFHNAVANADTIPRA